MSAFVAWYITEFCVYATYNKVESRQHFAEGFLTVKVLSNQIKLDFTVVICAYYSNTWASSSEGGRLCRNIHKPCRSSNGGAGRGRPVPTPYLWGVMCNAPTSLASSVTTTVNRLPCRCTHHSMSLLQINHHLHHH